MVHVMTPTLLSNPAPPTKQALKLCSIQPWAGWEDSCAPSASGPPAALASPWPPQTLALHL